MNGMHYRHQSACAIWDELTKKACDHEQKNL